MSKHLACKCYRDICCEAGIVDDTTLWHDDSLEERILAEINKLFGIDNIVMYQVYVCGKKPVEVAKELSISNTRLQQVRHRSLRRLGTERVLRRIRGVTDGSEGVYDTDSIWNLCLDNCILLALERGGVKTVGELKSLSDVQLFRIRGMSHKRIDSCRKPDIYIGI